MNKDQFRNGIAFGLVIGICSTIIFLLTLEVVDLDDQSKVTDWIGAIAAAMSVFVSTAAVFFVVETLGATREALKTTEAMSDDARKLGVAQLRAWIFIESVRFIPNDGKFRTEVTFRNFGQTPAVDLKTELYLFHNEAYPFAARTIVPVTDDFNIGIIPPTGTHYLAFPAQSVIDSPTRKTRIDITWSYKILNGDIISESETWVSLTDEGRVGARKMMPVDSLNYRPARP